jgi:dynein heavy chain
VRDSFGGVGCYFLRTSTKAITASTVTSDVYFGLLGPNIIPSLTNVVKNVILPALKAQVSCDWYKISKSVT